MGGVLDFLKGEKKAPDLNYLEDRKAAGIVIDGLGDKRLNTADGIKPENLTPAEREKWNKYVESQTASTD